MSSVVAAACMGGPGSNPINSCRPAALPGEWQDIQDHPGCGRACGRAALEFGVGSKHKISAASRLAFFAFSRHLPHLPQPAALHLPLPPLLLPESQTCLIHSIHDSCFMIQSFCLCSLSSASDAPAYSFSPGARIPGRPHGAPPGSTLI